MNRIFIISGPSGAGEDSIIKKLKKKIPFVRAVTTITRKKRRGEKEGSPYYFTDIENFKKRIAKNEFIEWAQVYGDYRGLTKRELVRLKKQKKPIVIKVDWQGVLTIKKLYPHAVSIGIMPESYDVLENRIIKRGKDSRHTIKKRAAQTKMWLKKQGVYDYIVINREGKLNTAVGEVEKIVRQNIKD